MAEHDNELRCPRCDSSIFVKPDQAGEKISCSRCQNVVLVPGRRVTSKDVTVDDLIEIDDDVLNPNPDGETIVAKSVDEAIEVKARHADLSDDLRLAPESNEAEGDRDIIAETGTPDPFEKTREPDDELGDLINIPLARPIEEQVDPFEVDKNANLEIEGVTPHEGQFGLTCNLCGSLLYARMSQVGTKIKCHDCHSLVHVMKPKVEPKPTEIAEPALNEEGGYSLSDPVELAPIDTTFDVSLGDIDYNDEDFFEKRREMSGATSPPNNDDVDEVIVIDEASIEVDSDDGGSEIFSDEEIVVITGDNDDDEYGLAPLAERPPHAKHEVPNFATTTNISNPLTIEPEEHKASPPPVTTRSEAKPKPNDKDIPAKVTAEAASGESETPDGLDHSSLFGNFTPWLKNATKPLRDLNCWLRIAIAAAAIGGCYMLIWSGMGYFTEEYTQIEKFGGFALVAFGGFPLLVILFFLGVMANSVVRISMEGRGSLSEWPDFSLADWFSQFIYLATSFWLAAFPGLILGSFISFATRNPMWLFLLIVISSLMLAPFILSSVVFNESPAAMMSADVFKSVRPLKNRWLRFLMAAFLIGVVFSLVILLAQFGIVAFLVAAIQVALLFVYWWILGDLVGHVVRWVIDKAGN